MILNHSNRKINVHHLVVLALSVLTASCMVSEPEGIDDISGLVQEEITITASLGEPETRTIREADGAVLWSPGDQISLFYGRGDNGGSCFTAQNTEAAKVVNFTGKIGVITGGNDVPLEGTYFWATYPYCAEASCDGSSITTVLPSAQLATADTFADDLFPSIGRSRGLDMAFYNICGGIKFTVSEEGIKTVTLKGNSGEQIAGKITVGFDDNGIPIVLSIADGSDTITLYAPDGESLEVGKAYYIVLVPTVFEAGFTLTFNKGHVQAVKNRTSKTTIRRSVFGTLNTPDQGLDWEFLSAVVPPDNEIWYTTEDNTIINLEASYPLYNSKPFDSNVISHTYENGKGTIKCDGPITTINKYVFSNSGNKLGFISQLFLPNSITDLNEGALQNLGTRELRIPDNLKYVGEYALQSPSFERFLGNQVSEDGRLVIIDDGFAPDYGSTKKPVKGYVAAFAPYNISSYALPDDVKELGWDVFSNVSLKEIVLNEGLEVIDGSCFMGSTLDCSIRIPQSLVSMDPYAFMGCSGIKSFYGNNRFHTEDGHCLVYYRGEEKWINLYVGEDEDYSIPEGVVAIENYTFNRKKNLKTVTLPSTLNNIGSVAFNECENLKALYGCCVSEDHRAVVFGDAFFRLFVTQGIKTYTIPDSYKSLGYEAFAHHSDLEEIVLPDSIVELGAYDFAWCNNLKKVVLSANLTGVGGNGCNPFLGSPNLEEVYFRSYLPPAYSDTQFYENDCSHLTIYVPEETLELYKSSGWSQYAPYMVGYHYDDIGEWNPDFYMSTDYSSDGSVTTLQQSTTGAGINLILMGDAFSDRQIADGTYANVMQKAMNAFFSEEPYKSMKDRFNVYTVNVVSATEGYEHSGQALGTGHGDGANVYGNDSKVIEYAKKAVSEDRMDDALIIVMMNEDAYAGTCYMYNPPSGNYGRGLSISYFPTSSNNDTFNGLVSHEAGGHGFAKLADEYAYEYLGAIPDDVVTNEKAKMLYGWWKNVDFTSDPAKVKWNQFLSDPRYANEGLGCFEGGLTYWTGVWRPSENSIMRYNTGGFNAPSRYAIWYRIGKLAYGESWEGSYEDFVAYDAINRTPAAVQKRQAQMRRQRLSKPLPPLAPPVVVNHSWREGLDNAR